MTDYPGLNDEFRDLLAAFAEHGVAHVIVGAHAMAVHGVPRATGDLDVLVQATPENARRVMAALRDFGAPLSAHGVTEDDFAREGTVDRIGLPPRRIVILTAISGVAFEDVWRERISATVDGGPACAPSKQARSRARQGSRRRPHPRSRRDRAVGLRIGLFG